MSAIRIAIPETAEAGEIIEIKALIRHPMESGFRPDARGKPIPRDIITKFECDYDGETIFSADFFPAVSANPFLTFHTRATNTGTLTFTWTDQTGQSWSETADLKVT